MFALLDKVFSRPEPFEIQTAKELWTDDYTANQMLKYHLDPEVDVSSRKRVFIERSVDWIVSHFSVGKDTRIVDFGCGPGLYTNRLARHSDAVSGIDFSQNSISYASSRAELEGLKVDYIHADYLEFELRDQADLVLMIMCDFCALSPSQRKNLLHKYHALLKPGGYLLLDVYSLAAFDARQEGITCAENLLNGFWSAERYFGFLNSFKYTDDRVMLDKYTIIEENRIRTFYNWLQYFAPADLLEDFRLAGFSDKTLFSNVAGDPFDPAASEFAIVARKG